MENDWILRQDLASQMGVDDRTVRRRLSALGLDGAEHQSTGSGRSGASVSPVAASKLLAEHGASRGGDSQLAREVDSYELENRALRAELERLQAESTVAQLRAELKVANDEVARLRVSGAAMAQALYGATVEAE